jgi:parallel beta-helix repeat protein
MRRALVTLVTLTLVVLGATPAAANAACGDVVMTDLKLTHDLTCGSNNGLIAGASDIVIDLNGHTITGDGTGNRSGVSVRAPHSGVVVRNGVIDGFFEGVVLDSNGGNHVWGLTLLNNGRGINLANTDDNLVEKNDIRDSTGDAIRLGGSDDNVIQKNHTSGGPFGISVADGSNDNTVAENDVVSGKAGFSFGISVFSNSDGNVVEKNYVTGMANEGIQVESFSDNTVVSKNHSSSNGTDGILVEGPTPMGTVIDKNTTNDNGDDGIDADSAATTLAKNQADDNGDLGIDAVAGVADGGGNRASGNGNPAQCLNVTCL